MVNVASLSLKWAIVGDSECCRKDNPRSCIIYFSELDSGE
uniref:Uncharacterized protein n=1 Tax=Arundo donax TaxID=35708 RepID=A0A0A8YHX8_ARUDO